MIYLAWVFFLYILVTNIVEYTKNKEYNPDVFRKVIYFASIGYIIQHYFGW